MSLIHFLAAIERLGKTNQERAAHLEMTARRFEQWKAGNPPRLLRILSKHPELISALLEDAEAAKETSIAS